MSAVRVPINSLLWRRKVALSFRNKLMDLHFIHLPMESLGTLNLLKWAREKGRGWAEITPLFLRKKAQRAHRKQMAFLKFPSSQILTWLIEVLEENRKWEKEDKMSLSIKKCPVDMFGIMVL